MVRVVARRHMSTKALRDDAPTLAGHRGIALVAARTAPIQLPDQRGRNRPLQFFFRWLLG
jgi:hypothetical protein